MRLVPRGLDRVHLVMPGCTVIAGTVQYIPTYPGGSAGSTEGAPAPRILAHFEPMSLAIPTRILPFNPAFITDSPGCNRLDISCVPNHIFTTVSGRWWTPLYTM
jgi:hypothetical protein